MPLSLNICVATLFALRSTDPSRCAKSKTRTTSFGGEGVSSSLPVSPVELAGFVTGITWADRVFAANELSSRTTASRLDFIASPPGDTEASECLLLPPCELCTQRVVLHNSCKLLIILAVAPNRDQPSSELLSRKCYTLFSIRRD